MEIENGKDQDGGTESNTITAPLIRKKQLENLDDSR